ncbi:MAG: metal-dependent hydrolase [Halobellus sp.]|uniref:metal-dependent hydrolase n=1 Tax=Halobellus sp. TaxID=1979212 RepID=UPI0035D50E50
MASTHGLASVALAAVLLPFAPTQAAPLVLAAALIGGTAPDLDVFAAHRKTFHYPVGYTALAAGVGGAHAVAPSPIVGLACVAVAAAAAHSWSDVLAGSVETEPWNPTTERAVYNHALGGWHRPRRLIRYSGAVEDFLLGFVCAGVAVAAPATSPTADSGLIGLVGLAGLYTVLRHPGVRLDSITERCPASLSDRLPSISVEETESGATTVAVRYR